MKPATYRRIFGACFGVAAGLAYGLSAQYCNTLFLPGMQFYQPPFDPLTNAGLWGLAAGILGLISSWPDEAIPGVFFSSLAGSLMIWGITFMSDQADGEMLTNRLISAVVFMVPLLALIVPLAALHRWVVARELDGWLSRFSLLLRGWLPVALVIVAALGGLTSLYGPVGRAELAAFNELIQEGLAASDGAALPEPFTPYLVGDFKASAVGSYALAWEGNDITRFGIPRPISPEPNEEGAAIARFENSWFLVCIYPARGMQPSCRGFQGTLP